MQLRLFLYRLFFVRACLFVNNYYVVCVWRREEALLLRNFSSKQAFLGNMTGTDYCTSARRFTFIFTFIFTSDDVQILDFPLSPTH